MPTGIDPTLIIVIVAAVIAVIVLVIGIINVRSEKDLIEERLGSYDQTSSLIDLEGMEEGIQEATKKVSFKDRMDDMVTSRPIGKKWRLALARADLKITPLEYALLHIVTVVGFFAAAYFVLWPQQIVMAVVGAFVGFFAPRLTVARMTA